MIFGIYLKYSKLLFALNLQQLSIDVREHLQDLRLPRAGDHNVQHSFSYILLDVKNVSLQKLPIETSMHIGYEMNSFLPVGRFLWPI